MAGGSSRRTRRTGPGGRESEGAIRCRRDLPLALGRSRAEITAGAVGPPAASDRVRGQGLMEETMLKAANEIKSTLAWLALLTALWASPGNAKECYAPDARSQERAFSRAVTTDGGKAIWLGGQTGS